MKFNKWTLGLAAVGAVSLASAARADEAKLSQVQTALSNTTISGVVDTAYQQSTGDVRQGPQASRATTLPNYFGLGTTYVDGFSLAQAIISLNKPLDETAWSAGYHIDLNYGDIVTSSSTPLRQAYVALNTPVGNGIDWKIGVMDGVTGYEGNTLSSNPNYTHSYGYLVNPSTLVGLVGQYTFTDWISAQAGYLNRGTKFSATGSDNLGQDDNHLQSHDYFAAVTFTAPETFGFMKGATLSFQTLQGFDNQSVDNYSAQLTIPTPVAGLKFGLTFDAVQSVAESSDGNIWGAYASWKATDKLTFNVRGEYVNAPDLSYLWPTSSSTRGEEFTATMEYNLWANVLSRLEFRWDHAQDGGLYANSTGDYKNAYFFAANIAYKF